MLAPGLQREEARRDTLPLKGLMAREELEESPGLKARVQRIVREPTGARDQKSKVHKTMGVRMGCGDGDGDGEQCGRWWTVRGMSGSNSSRIQPKVFFNS